MPKSKGNEKYSFTGLEVENGASIEISGGDSGLEVTMTWGSREQTYIYHHEIYDQDFWPEGRPNWRRMAGMGGDSHENKLDIKLDTTLEADRLEGGEYYESSSLFALKKVLAVVTPLMAMKPLEFAKTVDKWIPPLQGTTLTKLVRGIQQLSLKRQKERKIRERKEQRRRR